MTSANHLHPEHSPAHNGVDVDQATLFELDEASEKLFYTYKYDILSDPEMRHQYVQNTERLIARAIVEKIDDIVFLDKSARPVAWLMKSLWNNLGVDNQGNHVKMPEIRFANIDREQWEGIVGRSEDPEGIRVDNIPTSTIDTLRGVFTEKPLDIGEDATNEPTYFDDKNVMIVDEVMTSGDTLNITEKMFSRAFPEAKFYPQYWMVPEVKRNKFGVRYNAELPIWYNKTDAHGRLVANRETNVSRGSLSKRQRRGALFLSTRFPYMDEKGVRLKKEMAQLGQEVADGLMPVTPNYERSVEAQMAIIENIDHLSPAEFKALKEESKRSDASFRDVYLEYVRARALK